MRPTISLDISQWQRAARELAETDRRSCADFINGQALRVCVEAVRRTPKAIGAKIAWTLGQIGQEVSFKQRTRITTRGSKGSWRTVKGDRLIREDSFAERILAVRFRETGKWGKGIKGSTMAERVRSLIANRVRSAGFIASGWLPARKRLFAIVKEKPLGTNFNFAGVKQWGPEKGSVKPANFSLRSVITCEIQNTALLDTSEFPATGDNPMPVATAGLQEALNICARDMVDKLAERLSRDLKKFNAH